MTDITKRLAEDLYGAFRGKEFMPYAWKALSNNQRDQWRAVAATAMELTRTAAQEANVRYRSPRNIVTSRPLGVPSDYTFSEPQTLEELRAELDPTPAPASGEVFNILLGMRARLASYRDDGSVSREAGFWLMQEIGTALTIEAATRARQGEGGVSVSIREDGGKWFNCLRVGKDEYPLMGGYIDLDQAREFAGKVNALLAPNAADAEAHRAQIIWCSPKNTPQIGVGVDKSFIVCVQRASGKQYVFGATYANQFEIEWDDFRDSDKAEASGNNWRCEVGEDHDHATGWFVDDGSDGTRYMPLLSSDDTLIAWAAYPPPPIGAVIPTAAPDRADIMEQIRICAFADPEPDCTVETLLGWLRSLFKGERPECCKPNAAPVPADEGEKK